MHTNLHPSILEHAQRISEIQNISLASAIDRIVTLRPDYYRKLPLFTRAREKRPPFAVTPHFVRTLKSEAKKWRGQENTSYSKALDQVAYHSGFHDWKHVMKVADHYENTVVSAIERGLVFAMWYPQNPWDENKWDPTTLESVGLVHDPRIFFAASEELKNCYTGEDSEGGVYVLGFPVTNENGSETWSTKTESFMDEIRADVYRENNLPDLHFFRLDQGETPVSLDGARALIESALGPVRWNPQEENPPQPPLFSGELNLDETSVQSTMSTQISANANLPALGDRSNVQLHIPVIHYVWLKGEFFELDPYYF